MQELCQIQGHKVSQLSHICIFIDCANDSRWLCQECISNQIHDHIKGVQSLTYLRTELEFMNDFKSNIQPQIESRINSEEGILIKCKYIQNIKNALTNDAILKQVQNNDISFELSNIMLIKSIQDLIECSNLEISRIQNLKKAYKQLTNYGLRSLSLEEINIFLNNLNSIFQGENLLYKKVIVYLYKNYDEMKKKNFELRDQVLNLLWNSYIKLLRLKDYIQYHNCYTLQSHWIIDDQMIFLQNERYLARLIYKDFLSITDMNTKRFIKKIIFKQKPHEMSFENQSRHIIINDYHTLLHYYFSSNVRYIKQIRKYKFKNQLSNIQIVNHHKFMMSWKNFIEIRDLINNRCVNKIILQNNDSQNSQLFKVNYGKIQSIIVITFHDQNILIYKDDQSEPFIKQKINTLSYIWRIALTNDDLQLFTYESYQLKLWQIDYQEHELVLINMIQINQDDQFWFSDNSSFIIREYDDSIMILDKNFQKSQEIKQYRKHRCYHLQFGQQFILLIYGHDEYQFDSMIILRKARTDYDKLQFY